ncbi:helix-turn-helix transcriptional regulator [Acidovorax sp. FG27]|uniref:helix-turn-helix domain-containing protein n=1 Tax=Acidovorax sp. FG27 TaxID=3133652 RepID=UPI0033407B51
MEPDQAFGQALRSLRIRRKWSQTDLALRADVDRNYVSLMELGRNSPSVKMVFKLCDALDVAPSELLKDAEWRIKASRRPSPEI